MKKIRKILLMQPNYALLGKRTWEMPPYGLALLNACINKEYETIMFDPNFTQMDEQSIRSFLQEANPDLIGITSFSTEYISEVRSHTALIKELLPDCIVVLGGAYPTVMPEKAIQDPNVDFCVIGEGEYRLPALLHALELYDYDSALPDGISYRKDGKPVVIPMKSFVEPLDTVPFPDYGSLDLHAYGLFHFKYAHYLVPRQYPFAMTITSRGCPFDCIFCAARTVSGTKVRMRSAENVLAEIEQLVTTYGMKEIIFLDDHFLYNKKRATEIMIGIKERFPKLTWKCSNLAVFSLNRELLELMRDSGCNQLTLSLESGVQEILQQIIKKPVNLEHSKEMIHIAQQLDFELISNFVIGFPGETWEQIRRTIAFAESLDLDLVNFHIATPLPKTRLMDLCLEHGFISSEEALLSGYTKGIISTEEFTVTDLQILRAYEWDRINFKSERKIHKIAAMEGITLNELENWRRSTRKNLGTTVNREKHTI